MNELSPELTALLSEVTGTQGRFGHRQHVHLAFLAARRHGQARAGSMLCDWITQIAAAHGTPDKYHVTMTIAWAEIVAHHVAADQAAADFATFANRHPGLFDKSLLVRHYTPAVLGSSQARSGWVPPDRVPFPWA